ncbi:MAG: Hsp20/alpha crystallin family protein [Candidatus Magasanikbacteria bacterium]
MLPRIWEPFEEMENMFSHFPSLMHSRMNHGNGFVPAIDMYETDDAVMIEMPLSGVDASDIDISVENGILTLKGESNKEHEVDEKNYYRKEVRSGSFYRQVSLPVSVHEEKVTAESSEGMLKITCPKAAKAKAKKISVKVNKKSKK